ncbi:peptidase [Streptomyces botrytidirepellens]|uniref:peptidase n=1 Tax=Streptomyces botrytidirepellens TaxID=2486417 RepID=UPI001FE8D15F|nr:peptidase [Streptomyces botrytidirepellens]
MNVKTRALTALSTGVLLFGLVACGGSDSGGSGADSSQATQGAAGSDGGGGGGGGNAEAEGGEAGEAAEKPLTGEAKQKAEAAALKAHPGTVVKSEEDVENPGTYAVEIKKSDGSEVRAAGWDGSTPLCGAVDDRGVRREPPSKSQGRIWVTTAHVTA